MTRPPQVRTANTALRDARRRMDLSQDDLVKALRAQGWTSCDRRTVQRYESGEVTRPRYHARRALALVLQTPWQSLGFSGESDQQEARQPAPEGPEDMRRRTFSLGMATAAGLTAAEATTVASETVRHGLLASTPDAAPAAEVEEWESITSEYAVRHLTTPAAVLLRSYLDDLHHLNISLTASRNSTRGGDAAATDLYRVAALLTSLTAWTYGNLQAVEQAARWWRTAHRLAAASGDARTRVWVSAQEIVMALYQRSHSLTAIFERIEQVEPLADSMPANAGVAHLYGAKAQALGMAGRAADAERALQRLHDVFADLDPSITGDRDSFFGWPQTRLRYTESFTYAHLGDHRAAFIAQDRALSLYPSTVRRDPVKVELHRALCLARSGAVDDAARHACAQLASLDEAQHDLTMADLAGRVLRSLPPEASGAFRRSSTSAGTEIGELRRYCSSRPPASGPDHLPPAEGANCRA